MNNCKVLFILIGMMMFATISMGSSSAATHKNPYVTSINPSNGSTDISANKAISVVFNRQVFNGNGYVELKSNTGTTIPITTTLGKQKLKITPISLLKSGTKYTLYIHTGSFKDFYNNSIQKYSSSFTVSKNNPSASQVYFQVLNSEKKINGTQSYAKYAIYQKPAYSTHWNRYLFYHIVKAAVNGTNGPENVYRIYKLQNIVSNSVSGFPIINKTLDLTTPGNWEKAVQISGSPLMGGMHGYEIVTGIWFKGGGLSITPTNSSIASYKNFEIIENSNLINPKNITQVVAKTITTYKWNGNSFAINTVYQWRIKAKIITAYAAMFPAKESKTVAYEGQIQGEEVEKFPTRLNTIRANSAKGTVWDENNDLHMSMQILNPKSALNDYKTNGDHTNGKTWFRHLGVYIKLYMTRVHSPMYEMVTKTTTWYIKTTYSIWNEI